MIKYLEYMNTANGVQQIFTREKIANMSNDEFQKYEKRIHSQLNFIGIPSNNELEEYNNGRLFVWHTAGDEKVCDKCEPLDGKIFNKIQDVPDDPHLKCRCEVEEIDLGI